MNIPWTFDPSVVGPNAHLQDYIDRNGGNQIMLNADMALAFILSNGAQLQQVCGGGRNNCARESSTIALISTFIASNQAFVQQFASSYVKMVNVGYNYGTITNGKIGTLIQL